MSILAQQADKFIRLNKDTFEKLTSEKLRPQYNFDGLRLLALQAARERDLRELYRERAPYELLQNADDVGAVNAAFILTNDGLAFIHDGAWFTVDNFYSLAIGWSDKDPKECIGHKGLGFRSVLDITPAPHVIKIDTKEFFASKFTYQLNKGHIDQVLLRHPDLRIDHDKMTKGGRRVCPVMSIPGFAKKQSLGTASVLYDHVLAGAYHTSYSTMFWFPKDDPEIPFSVKEELSIMPLIANDQGLEFLLHFLKDEVAKLIPFLKSLSRVQVYSGKRIQGTVKLDGASQRRQRSGEISISTMIGSNNESISFFQVRTDFPIPQDKRSLPDTPHALKTLDRAATTLLMKLSNGQPVFDRYSFFHVYFPTQDSTGVGFTIHGDFYVKPDRTRLMPGGYNEWLIGIAAKKAANEFLTALLERYDSRCVYAALRKIGEQTTEGGQKFVSLYSKELRDRVIPFITSRAGKLQPREIILPHAMDKGFCDEHFSDVINGVIPTVKAFLAPAVDCRDTREFLRLVNATVAKPSMIIDCMEQAGQESKSPGWWYDCYEFLANDNETERLNQKEFLGKRIIPCSDGTVRSPAGESGTVLCLPPFDEESAMKVPACFSGVFVFIDKGFAERVQAGDEKTGKWILDRLGLVRFEASELLPKAIRSVVVEIFDGSFRTTWQDLITTWCFIYNMIRHSRAFVSPSFWQEIGRFPVPINESPNEANDAPDKRDLCPAFLAYWPDSFLDVQNVLIGVQGLRRVSANFVEKVVKESGGSIDAWKEFFNHCGISGAPKVLKYMRIIGSQQEIEIRGSLSAHSSLPSFTGERQRDQNSVVLHIMESEGIWDRSDWRKLTCEHNSKKLLQQVTVVEGLQSCAAEAGSLFEAGDPSWFERLWSLVRVLPADPFGPDSVYCLAAGGHSVPMPGCFKQQLQLVKCLPSTWGPASIDMCYLRHTTRRLVSLGRSEVDLGDMLLPYVVTDNVNDYAKLQQLGVELLEDAAYAKPQVLFRALTELGEVLNSDWGRSEILSVKSRWRLVRGAIQQIYTSLNRSDSNATVPENMKVAVTSGGQVRFEVFPVYYADPGSPIEQAFQSVLPLIDADRSYRGLFEKLHVLRLVSGETVAEELLGSDTATDLPDLRKEIIDEFAPYALAVLRAKSDVPKHEELVLRRLRERFRVQRMDGIDVSFTLLSKTDASSVLSFPQFYLSRWLEKGVGAIEEYHYTLFVVAQGSVSIKTLDPDALGSVLSPIFSDGSNEDFESLLPRLMSRYQYYQGDPEKMADFLYRELNVPLDALDWVTEELGSEGTNETAAQEAPAPIRINQDALGSSLGIADRLKERIQPHLADVRDKTIEIVRSIVIRRVSPSPGKHLQVTRQQQDQGVRGENEVKRRLELPGGWEGFSLLYDRRAEYCGYDFLCKIAEAEAKLEIKTFSPNGRVFVSSNELQAAAEDSENYYLIGVLFDESKSPREWLTYIVHNPLELLLIKGEFDVEARLKVEAMNLFENIA